MPFTGDTHLRSGVRPSNGTLSDAVTQLNTPFDDVDTSLGILKALHTAHLAATDPHSQYALEFPTLAVLAATNLSTLPIGTIIHIQGHTTAGIGGADWEKISTPALVRAWHAQSSDGGWFAISKNQPLNQYQFGAVDGAGSVSHVAIQALYDYAPIGSEVELLPGYMRIEQPITITRHVHTKASILCRLVGWFENATYLDDIIRIDVDTAGLGGVLDSNRQLRFFGGAAFFNGGAGFSGRNAIAINRNTTMQTFKCDIQGGLHAGFENTAGTIFSPAIYATGYSTRVSEGATHCSIHKNTTQNGVHLDSVADGWTVTENMIFGFGVGVRLNIVEGGYNTRILNNVITSRDGPLRVDFGSYGQFIGNQCEQGAGLVNQSNYGGNSAMIALLGAGARKVKGWTIENNNLGGGAGLVDILIYCDHTYKNVIDKNVMFPGTLIGGTTAIDVKLTANARSNIIGSANHLRDARSSAAYDARPDRKLNVQDLGDNNCSVWAFAADYGLTGQNGFGISSVEIKLLPDGTLLFDGLITVGGSTGVDVLIADGLAAGLRPDTYRHFLAQVDSSAGVSRGVACLALTPAGQFLAHTLPAGTTSTDFIFMRGVSTQVQFPSTHDGSNG